MIDVSEEVPEDEVKALLTEAGVNSNPEGWAEGSRIHVNGDIFGLHKDPNRLVSNSNADVDRARYGLRSV